LTGKEGSLFIFSSLLCRLPHEEKALKKGVYSLLIKEAIFGPRKKGPFWGGERLPSFLVGWRSVPPLVSSFCEKLKNPKNALGESGGQKSKKAKYAQNVPFLPCFSKKGPKRLFLAPFWDCQILIKKAIF